MTVIILDTETTGIDCRTDRLVELAAVPMSEEMYRPFSTLVNPGRDIPPEAKAVHHITEQDVAGAPEEGAAMSMLSRHYDYGISYAVAHNAKFDKGFIDRIVPANGLVWIDTYKLALLAWPEAPGHSNQVLRYWLNLDLTTDLPEGLFPHRALYDTIVTRGILRRLQDLYSLDVMAEISNKPVLLKKVTFGKHKGMAWSDVPYGYLKWCVSQSDMNENVLFTAKYYMERR